MATLLPLLLFALSVITPAAAWTRRYTLVCLERDLVLDGTSKRMLTWNGTLPGPTLTAVEHDTMEITVINRCTRPITAHWHGMLQTTTPYFDGVPSVTQCAIEVGKSMVYKFRATPAGTAWYHSHQGVQYMEGLFGPLLISPHPTATGVSLGRIDDVKTLTFSDFYHNATAQLLAWYKSPASQGNEPVPDSGLINGVGRFNCSLTTKPCTTLPYPRFRVQPGKRTLFHVISAAAFSAFRFSVDGHRIRVISVDLTYIQPDTVDVMSINVGQRVSFFLEPLPGTATDRNYWIRAEMETACYSYVNPVLNPDVRAVLEYVPTAGDPSSASTPERTSQECRLLDYTELVPLIKKDVPWFRNGVDYLLTLNFIFKSNAQNVNYAYVNGQTYVAGSVPTLQLMAQYPSLKYPNGTSVLAPNANAFVLPDRAPGGWAFMAINNFDNGEHPWHKHNTVSFLLGQGRDGPFNWATMQGRLKYTNPLRRDTFTVPYGDKTHKAGWAVIAWPVDSPGAWVIHCHIEWHVSVGLLAQIVQWPKAVAARSTAWPAGWQNCAATRS